MGGKGEEWVGGLEWESKGENCASAMIKIKLYIKKKNPYSSLQPATGAVGHQTQCSCPWTRVSVVSKLNELSPQYHEEGSRPVLTVAHACAQGPAQIEGQLCPVSRADLAG